MPQRGPALVRGQLDDPLGERGAGPDADQGQPVGVGAELGRVVGRPGHGGVGLDACAADDRQHHRAEPVDQPVDQRVAARRRTDGVKATTRRGPVGPAAAGQCTRARAAGCRAAQVDVGDPAAGEPGRSADRSHGPTLAAGHPAQGKAECA